MKLKKRILTSGFHFVGDKKGGRKAVYISPSRINHWVSQHNKMREKGLNIPAPEYHATEENPNKYFKRQGSKSNYGFWDKLETSVDENGHVTLEGIIDSKNETDANKLGNTVRETSVFSENKFIDGDGGEWEDVLTHIACVTKPIEAGQKNFEPVHDFDQSISMSHAVSMDLEGIGKLITEEEKAGTELVTLLRTVAGLEVPVSCSKQDLEEYLIIALKQKQLSELSVDGGTVDKPPKNSETNEVPVVMAQQTQTPASTPAVDPNVSTPAVPVEMSQGKTGEVIPPDSKIDAVVMSQHTGMMNHLESERKSQASSRLKNLVARGIVKDQNTAKSYQTQIDAIQMSFDENGKPVRSAIEMTLDNLDQIQISMPENAPSVSMASDENGQIVIQQNPTPTNRGSLEGWTEEDLNDTVEQMLNGTKF